MNAASLTITGAIQQQPDAINPPLLEVGDWLRLETFGLADRLFAALQRSKVITDHPWANLESPLALISRGGPFLAPPVPEPIA